MKKNLLIFCLLLFSYTLSNAQTAPDFTANDCNGNSHNLYSELNSGKVIVLCWVMPCFSCVGPSLTAYNIVQSYSSSNVLFYLIDDDGLTVCSTIDWWATNAGIGPNRTNFSSTSIIQNNYGGNGMPHVAVVGTSNHTIYFNGLNGAAGDATGIQNGINSAISAIGIEENINSSFQLAVLQSAASSSLTANYSLLETGHVTFEILNELGQRVSKKEIGRQQPGTYRSDLYADELAAGIYFLRLTSNNKSQVVKFLVTD